VDVTEMRQAEGRALQGERLAAIGQAMTSVIYEGRNALQRGQACLEVLALESKDRPKALDLIARAQRALDDLRQLHEDVREYAAPIRLECRECNLGTAWRGAWADLEPVRRGRTAMLCEDFSGSNLHVVADPKRLTQVFRNLLENALAAALDPVEVVISAAASELNRRPALTIVFRDNGPRLKSEQARRAFDPFYTTKAKGTGLLEAFRGDSPQYRANCLPLRNRSNRPISARRAHAVVLPMPRSATNCATTGSSAVTCSSQASTSAISKAS
jgi:signal transduction histidine kinase